MATFISSLMNETGRCTVLPHCKRRVCAVLLGAALLLASVGSVAYAEEKEAVFAGGCFWCLQAPIEKLEGVIDTTVGFSGGSVADPSYKDVVAGGTGHYEVIQVIYDDERLAYEDLLDVFWKNIDPYDDGGQFCDRGESYLSAIFYFDEMQKEVATRSRDEYDEVHPEQIVTPIIAFDAFYPAEEYHQDYHVKNPRRYTIYRALCGRDNRLRALWGR